MGLKVLRGWMPADYGGPVVSHDNFLLRILFLEDVRGVTKAH